MSTTSAAPPETSNLAGKPLTFVLGHEHYGVPVLKVREIIRLGDITPVPQMPDDILGLAKIKGTVKTLLDIDCGVNAVNVEKLATA